MMHERTLNLLVFILLGAAIGSMIVAAWIAAGFFMVAFYVIVCAEDLITHEGRQRRQGR